MYNGRLHKPGGRLKEFVDTLISWGPAGLFLLALVDSAGVPIPGGVDALIVVLAVTTPGKAYFAAWMAVIGSVIGNYILYWIARRGGRAFLDARTQAGRGAKAREWFQRYGLLTVFVPTVLPIPFLPMKAFILSAAAMGVRTVPFLSVIAIARLIRYYGLAYLGIQLGEHSAAYLKEHFWHLLVFALLLVAVLYFAIRAFERRRLNSAT